MSDNNENEIEELKVSSEEESEEKDETEQKITPKKSYKDYLIQLLSDPPKKPINLKTPNTTILKPILKSKIINHETPHSVLFKSSDLKNKNNQNLKSIPDFKVHLYKFKNNRMITTDKAFRTKLDKMYGYNKQFLNKTRKIKRNKKNTNIEKYQNKILKLSCANLSRDNIAILYSNLNKIKRETEDVKPLPPINYPALITHSCLQSERKEKYKKSLGISNYQKKLNEMDDYEKELYCIKLSKHKKNDFNNEKDKRIIKLHEILPEYLIQALYNKSPKRNYTEK